MSERRTRTLAKRLQLPIKKILVRGGTDHRKDLHLEDGTILYLWPDGIFTIYIPREPIIKDPSIPDECRV